VPSDEAKMTFFSSAVIGALVVTALAVAMGFLLDSQNHRPMALGAGLSERALTRF